MKNLLDIKESSLIKRLFLKIWLPVAIFGLACPFIPYMLFFIPVL